MAIHKRVPPLRAEPSSEYIVKLSYDLLTTYVSVTTVVLRTTDRAVLRCADRPQCGAKVAAILNFHSTIRRCQTWRPLASTMYRLCRNSLLLFFQ